MNYKNSVIGGVGSSAVGCAKDEPIKETNEVETCIAELHFSLSRVLEAVNFLGGRLSPVLSNQQPEKTPVSRPMPAATCHVSSMINEAHDKAQTCEQYLNNLIAALRV